MMGGAIAVWDVGCTIFGDMGVRSLLGCGRAIAFWRCGRAIIFGVCNLFWEYWEGDRFLGSWRDAIAVWDDGSAIAQIAHKNFCGYNY